MSSVWGVLVFINFNIFLSACFIASHPFILSPTFIPPAPPPLYYLPLPSGDAELQERLQTVVEERQGSEQRRRQLFQQARSLHDAIVEIKEKVGGQERAKRRREGRREQRESGSKEKVGGQEGARRSV